jgi:hypothetical protein
MLNYLLNNVTTYDLLYAAVLAFVLTWLIRNILRIRSIIKNVSETSPFSNPKEIGAILERCYSLFPLDKISFHGRVFSRGMKIRIVTTQNKSFIGEFIGGNSKNMLCIMTSKNIVAHDITNITDITAVEEQ